MCRTVPWVQDRMYEATRYLVAVHGFVLSMDTTRTQIHDSVYLSSLLQGSDSKCPVHAVPIWLRDGRLRSRAEDGHALEDLVSLLSQLEEEPSKLYRRSVS